MPNSLWPFCVLTIREFPACRAFLYDWPFLVHFPDLLWCSVVPPRMGFLHFNSLFIKKRKMCMSLIMALIHKNWDSWKNERPWCAGYSTQVKNQYSPTVVKISAKHHALLFSKYIFWLCQGRWRYQRNDSRAVTGVSKQVSKFIFTERCLYWRWTTSRFLASVHRSLKEVFM